MSVPQVLTIAGSDSSGGAGIQADLKTFSALGCYGASVITALTAQNTQGVRAVHMTAPNMVRAQIDAVYDDLNISATKIGMVATAEVANEISDGLQRHRPQHIVLDPVMVAESGDLLMEDSLIGQLKDTLLPLADVITPNLHEAAVLLGCDVAVSLDEMREQARALSQMSAGAMLVKGGHFAGEAAVDVLVLSDASLVEFSAPRIPTRNTHGTGCTLSSAIACFLARGLELERAVQQAKDYISGAIGAADGLDVGHGAGPVHHFYDQWTS